MLCQMTITITNHYQPGLLDTLRGRSHIMSFAISHLLFQMQMCGKHVQIESNMVATHMRSWSSCDKHQPISCPLWILNISVITNYLKHWCRHWCFLTFFINKTVRDTVRVCLGSFFRERRCQQQHMPWYQ